MNPLNFLYSGLAGMALGAFLTFIPMEKMYLSYKATVEAVGKQQEERAKEIGARHKQIVGDLNAHWKAITQRDAGRIKSLGVQLANLGKSSLLPSYPAGPSVSGRICYTDPAEFARKISDALNEAAAEDFGDSQLGQRGIDVASQASQWVKELGSGL